MREEDLFKKMTEPKYQKTIKLDLNVHRNFLFFHSFWSLCDYECVNTKGVTDDVEIKTTY